MHESVYIVYLPIEGSLMTKTNSPQVRSRTELLETLKLNASHTHAEQTHSLQGTFQDFELYSALDYSIQTTVATDTRAIARTA